MEPAGSLKRNLALTTGVRYAMLGGLQQVNSTDHSDAQGGNAGTRRNHPQHRCGLLGGCLCSTRPGVPHGGATTTGPDATYPPAICQNSGGGGGGGGGQSWRGVRPGVGGGVRLGVGGGSYQGSGGVLPGVGGGVWPVVRGASDGVRGGGLGLGLGSPSWWNQSWFYNPF